jgi:transcription elongation factor GreB
MSKAFTKEEASEDELPEEEIELPTGSPVITRQGYEKLQAELDQLWRVERPKVTTEVMWAAAQGDRSENAEYIYGKRRLREIDRRLRFLKKRLDSLTVVEPHKDQLGKVFFGATVTVEDEDGKKSTYRFVGSDEIDLKKGWISVDSPLAKALLGKEKGDYALVNRPKGETEVKILSIKY